MLFCLRKFVGPTIKCARYPSIQDAFEEAWNIYHTDNPRALTDSRDRIRGLIREKTGEQTLRQAKRDNARLTEDLTSILSCFFNLSKRSTTPSVIGARLVRTWVCPDCGEPVEGIDENFSINISPILLPSMVALLANETPFLNHNSAKELDPLDVYAHLLGQSYEFSSDAIRIKCADCEHSKWRKAYGLVHHEQAVFANGVAVGGDGTILRFAITDWSLLVQQGWSALVIEDTEDWVVS